MANPPRKVIYKYVIPFGYPPAKIQMPRGAVIRACQRQKGEICIWAEHDINEIRVDQRDFVIIGTGHEFVDNGNMSYIGTIQTDGGDFVWHIYEIR